MLWYLVLFHIVTANLNETHTLYFIYCQFYSSILLLMSIQNFRILFCFTNPKQSVLDLFPINVHVFEFC